FDLRAEFAALAAEPRPQALWERIERLAPAFDQEQQRRARAVQRPGELRSDAPAGSAGFAAQSGLSGDLGVASAVSAVDSRVQRA
ncbi:hypothetical protein NL463_29100, partial [Klebsiella pneumoniae]|nr:hypothetical protein [Klebsiella pneumoniae]